MGLVQEVLYKLLDVTQMFLFIVSLNLTIQMQNTAVSIYFDTDKMAFQSDKKDI